MGYASVNEHNPLHSTDSVVTILFHDSCSLVEVPDCSFTAGLQTSFKFCLNLNINLQRLRLVPVQHPADFFLCNHSQ